MRTQTTIRLPGELMEQLRREADTRSQSWNCLLGNILWRFVRAYRTR